jgi:hypothetical protein
MAQAVSGPCQLCRAGPATEAKLTLRGDVDGGLRRSCRRRWDPVEFAEKVAFWLDAWMPDSLSATQAFEATDGAGFKT